MIQTLIIGMPDDDLRRYALEIQALHDPANQVENGYERCEHCHYTRHPCEVHDLATAVIALIDARFPAPRGSDEKPCPVLNARHAWVREDGRVHCDECGEVRDGVC